MSAASVNLATFVGYVKEICLIEATLQGLFALKKKHGLKYCMLNIFYYKRVFLFFTFY